MMRSQSPTNHAPNARRPLQVKTSNIAASRLNNTKIASADRASLSSLEIENVAVDLDESTHVLNPFISYIQDRNLKAVGTPQYTPNFEATTHVLQLPFHEPKTGHYKLLKDDILSHNYKMFDRGVTKSWKVRAHNLCDSEEDPVNLFTIHTTVVSRMRCPPCRQDLSLAHATLNSGRDVRAAPPRRRTPPSAYGELSSFVTTASTTSLTKSVRSQSATWLLHSAKSKSTS
jgi:hypothetical protein